MLFVLFFYHITKSEIVIWTRRVKLTEEGLHERLKCQQPQTLSKFVIDLLVLNHTRQTKVPLKGQHDVLTTGHSWPTVDVIKFLWATWCLNSWAITAHWQSVVWALLYVRALHALSDESRVLTGCRCAWEQRAGPFEVKANWDYGPSQTSSQQRHIRF